MARYVIRGNVPLTGVISPLGNKNAVLPMLAASLLTNEPVRLTNVPDIRDVRVMLDLLEALGAEITHDPLAHTACVRCEKLSAGRLLDPRVMEIRASILFVGALLARCGHLEILPPGGCTIGQRQVETHFANLSGLGVQVHYGNPLRATTSGLKGAFVWSDETSVTATANFLLAAVLAEGKSTLYNAASEPHIQDLCRMLNAMGAQIEGIGTNRLTIYGRRALHGVEYRVAEDYVEAGSFLAAAAATGGRVTVKVEQPGQYRQIVRQFAKLGIQIEVGEQKLTVRHHVSGAVAETPNGRLPKIECLPWPGFPADLLPITLVAATQSCGRILFHDKMFESRLFFVDKIIRMGAEIFLSDPHRAIVFGPSRLRGGFIESPDLRAGMAMVIAALAATGISTIARIQVIERGYERLDERLRSLGADIVRIMDHDEETY